NEVVLIVSVGGAIVALGLLVFLYYRCRRTSSRKPNSVKKPLLGFLSAEENEDIWNAALNAESDVTVVYDPFKDSPNVSDNEPDEVWTDSVPHTESTRTVEESGDYNGKHDAYKSDPDREEAKLE